MSPEEKKLRDDLANVKERIAQLNSGDHRVTGKDLTDAVAEKRRLESELEKLDPKRK